MIRRQESKKIIFLLNVRVCPGPGKKRPLSKKDEGINEKEKRTVMDRENRRPIRRVVLESASW